MICGAQGARASAGANSGTGVARTREHALCLPCADTPPAGRAGSQVRPASRQAGAGAHRGPRRSVRPVVGSQQLAALLAACLCALALPLVAASGASEHGGGFSAEAAVASHGARQASTGEAGVETLAHTHMRRKLINLDTAAGTRYFHQPLVNCLVANVSNSSSFYPSGVTMNVSDCAARCDAIPTCIGFKYPWFMNTQPAANTVPVLTNGQTWNWCIPLDSVNISTCTAEIRWDNSANYTQFRPQDIWEMYWRGSSRQWPAAPTWTTFYNWWGNATQPPPAPSPPAKAEVDVPLTAGLTVGLGAPLLIAASAAVTALLMRTVLRGSAAPSTSRRKPDGSRQNDVFVSYRRQDLQVADAVHDKLVLAGLRVFYDRGGGMAGRPFEVELFLAIKSAPVFAPVITLGDITHWAAHDVTKVDYTLAEFIVALHFARAGRIQLFFPLLVGEWQERPAAAGGGERDYLMSNPDFKKAREALPMIVPTATIAVVKAMFAAAGKGETLDAVVAGSTVRDLIVGSSPRMHISKEASLTSGDVEGGDVKPVGGPLRGVLEMDSAMLYGPDEQSGLVLRHRYAESILTALYGKEEKK